MTVCGAIEVHDCIMFAADSAVSVTALVSDGTSVLSNVWQRGLKVFYLHRDLPIMAMTTGMGNFGSASVDYLAKDLRLNLMEHISSDTGLHDRRCGNPSKSVLSDRVLENKSASGQSVISGILDRWI